MSVFDRFNCPVSEEMRTEALLLIEAGAVEIHVNGDDAFHAKVAGPAGEIELVIQVVDGRFSANCSCAEYEERGNCVHTVAAAIAGDRKGFFSTDNSHETRPRRRDRESMWLSPRGDLKRIGDNEARPVVRTAPSMPSWRKQMERLKSSKAVEGVMPWPAGRNLLYILDLQASMDARSAVIRLAYSELRSNGDWSKPRFKTPLNPNPAEMPNIEDRTNLAMLRGAHGGTFSAVDPHYQIPPAFNRMILPALCATDRLMLRTDLDADELIPLKMDSEAYSLWLEGRREESTQHYILTGSLRRGEQRIPLSRTLAVLEGGIVVFSDHLALVEDRGAESWAPMLRAGKAMAVPFAQGDELLKELFSLPTLPNMELPQELAFTPIHTAPRPRLVIRHAGSGELRPQRLRAVLRFDYGSRTLEPGDGEGRPVFFPTDRQLVVRDQPAEKQAGKTLEKLGLRPVIPAGEEAEYWFHHRHIHRVIGALIDAGWAVESDGRIQRQPGKMKLSVSTGIDWFELRGEVDFGEGKSVPLSELLSALKRGEQSVQLSDGSLGLLPHAWLATNGFLLNSAKWDGDALKFSKSQIGLLDALLAAAPEANLDEMFNRLRKQLKLFEGVKPLETPGNFVGSLRPYQCDGLGWFEFLRTFSFGGCLADDMGLGKTVQVLALLETRRALREDPNNHVGPSLVVAPRSLVFNWKQEAIRFVPKLRILDHTGIDRVKGIDHLEDYDMILTTYGTLRRDAIFLKDLRFDYVVLDEAQAVKNPSSESAKAVRLVNGTHRMALSGTPVQNNLGDLWSLFEFLNPGMLGTSTVFSEGMATDENSRRLLSRALRPFILRRTKEQVAADLPKKLEQTIFCELEGEQKRLYEQLRDGFRKSLLAQVDRDGMGKSKMLVLEALLRLRQAALHPGLIDPTRIPEGSAKLDMLVDRLTEIIGSGHKALVFSQFTSMLAIVRDSLDKLGIKYEYLDGKTRDRQQHVERFQNDETCKLFLVSLKAGGLGLNLTAADYVYLLDPWWNPAVETQAIDRAHRIGQTRPVFACRIIAKDTVEEKVLSLQQSKQKLADAIINAENSLIRDLDRDDLELLLS